MKLSTKLNKVGFDYKESADSIITEEKDKIILGISLLKGELNDYERILYELETSKMTIVKVVYYV